MGGRVGWSRTLAMLVRSVLGLRGGLIAQDAGGCGGRDAPSPGSAGMRLAGGEDAV